MDPEEVGPVLQQLSAQATHALEEAVAAAQLRGHGFVGVDHLAWGILQLGETTQRIRESGIDPVVVRLALEQCLGAVFRVPSEPNAVPDCTPRVFSVLKNRAPAVACRRGHLRVEPDDLLIAVLQEEATPLVEALRERGVDAADLVNRLCKRVQPRFEIPSGIQPWCHDLTAQAERGELLSLVGREKELRQIVRILTIPKGLGPRNPLLVGPAGVGKTALIEGLAQRIAKGEEPRLRDVRIIQVNMNVMQENTVFRGQFEARLQQTIEFAKGPPSGGRVVLFLDEMHLIVGAGRAIGAPADAAQILLQPLGRGEVQIIGATTTEQYERHLSDDDAVVRRFSTVEVDEPSLDETRAILQGIRTELEVRFQTSGDKVRVTDEAIEAAVQFSSRYLLSQRLPHKPRQWVVDAMVHCAREGRSEALRSDVGAVVAEATGIPPEILFRSTQWSPEHWQRVLGARVRGQDEAVREVSHRVLMNLGPLRANLRKPIGVFLFVGPTGVGKTELAKALAELLFADEDRMIRLDMSEFRGEMGVQRLIGPPRGIVGAGRGELTDRIRRKPYSVVLLDEFEKADPQVRTLFLQVFDEGWLADGLGRTVYFRDAIIILTSNLGAVEYHRLLSRLHGGYPTDDSDAEFLTDARKLFRKAVTESLSPELANRISAVCLFSPLSLETTREIAQILLDGLKEQLRQQAKELILSDGVVELLAERGHDRLHGARALVRQFEKFVAYELSPREHEGHSFRVDVVETDADGHRERGLKVTVETRVQPESLVREEG